MKMREEKEQAKEMKQRADAVKDCSAEMKLLVREIEEILSSSSEYWSGGNAEICREHGRVYSREAAENLRMLARTADEISRSACAVHIEARR